MECRLKQLRHVLATVAALIYRFGYVYSNSLSGLLEWDRSQQPAVTVPPTLPELFLELSEVATAAASDFRAHRKRVLQQTLSARVPDVGELLLATGHRRERTVLRYRSVSGNSISYMRLKLLL